ncbi:pyrophosphatase PpaX [Marinicrinis sediminis]|uniref:Pyrophosphatase PpaX n=1 Tax=Marinicrinis sediminis TaxID=1652465 RepID=A0ABW5R8B7_9BACL
MINTVLFDLDGTILDTNELIIESFMHVMEGRSFKPLTRDWLIQHMGKPLNTQLRYFTNRAEEEDVEDLVKLYRTYNLERHDDLVRAFPHTLEVCEALKQQGVRMGVVTSKVRLTSEKGLRLCKLMDYMDTIVTVEDVQHPKPHPEPVLRALQEMNAEPGQTLMVGDSPYDIEAANRAGVRSVAVSWSLKDKELLQTFQPYTIIEDMNELLHLVNKENQSQ